MKDQVLKIKYEIIEILKQHDVKKAAFFGSIIRDDFNEDSDIDILIEFRGRKSLLDLVRLKRELEEKINRKIDILTYNSLHPLLRDKILQHQQVIL
ncbi:MAG: hypothetical protein EU549_03375 [Promethearchaeota archaeon]|nr:MAG: hypothetical protein EU549_03375 [Candidatus Lokiarchaeota archaeon]